MKAQLITATVVATFIVAASVTSHDAQDKPQMSVDAANPVRGVPARRTLHPLAAGGGIAQPGEIRLWDNGLGYRGGNSHLTIPVRRSVLDDFRVDEPGWVITGFHLKFAWATGEIEKGSDLELIVYGDIDGQPDFDTMIAVAENRVYEERRDMTDPDFFGLTPVDCVVRFDEIHLAPGLYWIDMHVVGPENGFHINAPKPQSILEPLWVDYEDFGGRQPGADISGEDRDEVLNLFGRYDCNPACELHAGAFSINLGAYRSGDIEDTRASDDTYLLIEPRPGLTASFPLVRMEFCGPLLNERLADLSVIFESGVNSIPTQSLQRLSLFDFEVGDFETIDERVATLTDSVVEAGAGASPSRFVEPLTLDGRLRVEYFDPGDVFLPSWVVRIDEVLFAATPCPDGAVIFEDDFDADLGWTVVNEQVTEGEWERAQPYGLFDAQPAADYDFEGDGLCYVTGGSSQDIDLDGGPTRLVSPTIDLSGPGPHLVRYARWMRSLPQGQEGVMEIEVSNDNGSTWVTVDTLDGDPFALWGTTQFTLEDFLAPTATVKFRFSVTDLNADSSVEAGLDSFSISRVECP